MAGYVDEIINEDIENSLLTDGMKTSIKIITSYNIIWKLYNW